MAIDYTVADGILRINCLNWAIAPSIEDSDACMGIVIDKLLESKDANRIILAETREYEYDTEQTRMLREIAEAYDKILNEDKIVSIKNLGPPGCEKYYPQRLAELQFLVSEVLKKDPIGAYVKINTLISHLKKQLEFDGGVCHQHYLSHALEPMKSMMEKTALIQKVKPNISKFIFGDRKLYREIFTPIVRPNFMLTRFMLVYPQGAIPIDKYTIPGNVLVEILKVPNEVRHTYHIIPQEFQLSEEKFTILDAARRYLAAHKPSEAEVKEPESVRETFLNIGKDLVRDIARNSGIVLSTKDIQELATILARYTAGFGVLELLLADDKIQDVFINSPIGTTPVEIVHSDFEECRTNLIPTKEDADAWATRFRLYSGRPLDEANPVLDTEINVPGGRARVAAITRSLSPEGLAFAFRRHREKPWTVPLFMNVNFFDSLYAGLMSFVIDGGRALLVAGGRGSGKTSLLNAMMLEIMRKFRICVVEDTPELNITLMRKLGYNILGMKARSVITHIETELAPDEALRTALRLGDSSLIIGEVRSKESVALFEAMRIGALANVVAGTIHGESAYGVYDRVVHDLGVVPTSFKALDLIIICNQLRSPDGLHRFRRVTELTEVRKHWKEDPLDEGGFVPLMQYSAKEDRLKPTDTLIDGESEVLNEIAKRVREWHGAWDLVWDNILLRAKINEEMVASAKRLSRLELLEAEWVTASNEAFHLISQDVIQEVGSLDSKMIFERWHNWFKDKIKS